MSSTDISCVTYDAVMQHRINYIAANSEKLRTWTRFNGTRPNYLISDPSCGGPLTYNQRLMNKKTYIFANNNNNVVNGPIGSNSGTGGQLTKFQIYARAARGYNPQTGMPTKKYGVQSPTYTNPNIYDLSNVSNTLLACSKK